MRMALRWAAALGTMAFVGVLSFVLALDQLRDAFVLGGDGGEAGASPAASPSPVDPVVDGATSTVADVEVDAGVISDVSGERLRIGGDADDAVLVQFPLIQGDATCLGTVTLHMTLEEATPAELFVFPAAVFDITALDAGYQLPQPAVLTSHPMGIAVTDGTPGVLQWDITTLYRQWVTQQPFTPGAAGVPRGTPLVVTVTPVEGDPTREVRFAASEQGDEQAPRIAWTADPACPVPT